MSSLLTADNYISINTLLQPQLVASGVPVSQSAAYRFFTETIRRNLRIVFLSPDPNTWGLIANQIIKFSPSLLSCLSVVYLPAFDKGSLLDIARERISLNGSLGDSISESAKDALVHSSVGIYLALWGVDNMEQSDEVALKRITVDHFIQHVDSVCIMVSQRSEALSLRISEIQTGIDYYNSTKHEADRLSQLLLNEKQTLQEKQNVTAKLLMQLGRDSASIKSVEKSLTEINDRIKKLSADCPEVEAKKIQVWNAIFYNYLVNIFRKQTYFHRCKLKSGVSWRSYRMTTSLSSESKMRHPVIFRSYWLRSLF